MSKSTFNTFKDLVAVTLGFMRDITLVSVVNGGFKPTSNLGASPGESSDFLIIAGLLETCSIVFNGSKTHASYLTFGPILNW